LLQKGHAWYWYSTTFRGNRSVGGRSFAFASAAATVAKVREKDTAPATPAGIALGDGGGKRGGGTIGAHHLEPAAAEAAAAAAGEAAPWSGRAERRERKVRAARRDLIVRCSRERRAAGSRQRAADWRWAGLRRRAACVCGNFAWRRGAERGPGNPLQMEDAWRVLQSDGRTEKLRLRAGLGRQLKGDV